MSTGWLRLRQPITRVDPLPGFTRAYRVWQGELLAAELYDRQLLKVLGDREVNGQYAMVTVGLADGGVNVIDNAQLPDDAQLVGTNGELSTVAEIKAMAREGKKKSRQAQVGGHAKYTAEMEETPTPSTPPAGNH